MHINDPMEQMKRESVLYPLAPALRSAPTPASGEAGGVPTLGAIMEQWLEGERLQVKRSTWATYSGAAFRHIAPELGAVPVDELTPARLSAFFENRRHLAPASLRLIGHTLRSVLDCARYQGYSVPSPAAMYLPHASRTEARTLDAAAQKTLEAGLRRDLTSANLGILLCLHTGIRLGEVCALKWGDFAPDCDSFRIRRTLSRIQVRDGEGARTRLSFDTPKSAASNRRIPVPASLHGELIAARRGDECFFLTGSEEKAMEPRRFQARFKTVLRRFGLEDINFHALRHTFATNCISLGCDPTTLSRILGHSDVAITLNTYVHPSFDVMRSIMDKLG